MLADMGQRMLVALEVELADMLLDMEVELADMLVDMVDMEVELVDMVGELVHMEVDLMAEPYSILSSRSSDIALFYLSLPHFLSDNIGSRRLIPTSDKVNLSSSISHLLSSPLSDNIWSRR